MSYQPNVQQQLVLDFLARGQSPTEPHGDPRPVQVCRHSMDKQVVMVHRTLSYPNVAYNTKTEMFRIDPDGRTTGV